MQLLEGVEGKADQVEEPRAVDVARELHDLPGVARRQPLGIDDRRGALGRRQAPLARRRVLAARGLGAGVELEQVADRAAQPFARLDQVEHPVLEQEARRLEPVGQLLADRLLDHGRPGEADVRVGLGDQDVAERRVGGADAAVGWVGQQRDEQHALLRQARHRLARS